MTIKKTQENNKLTMEIEGRLDSTTAPDLENEVRATLKGSEDLVLDFAQLQYISSAGLRVLLLAKKLLKNGGTLKICNVHIPVMEVFDITGFSDILDITPIQEDHKGAADAQ